MSDVLFTANEEERMKEYKCDGCEKRELKKFETYRFEQCLVFSERKPIRIIDLCVSCSFKFNTFLKELKVKK